MWHGGGFRSLFSSIWDIGDIFSETNSTTVFGSDFDQQGSPGCIYKLQKLKSSAVCKNLHFEAMQAVK
jgi:hypothetical protein